ncbi:MAG: ABC transporter ATP-binding protein, partial [Clostridia bacterium]
AILANKDIYLIDEVTSGVDFQTMLSIEDYLLKNSNITLIYISHHLSKDMMGRFDKIIDLSA